MLMLVVMQFVEGEPSMPSFDPFGFMVNYYPARAEFELKCMFAIGAAAVVLLTMYVFLKAQSNQPFARAESGAVAIAHSKPVATAHSKVVRPPITNRRHGAVGRYAHSK